MLKRAIYGLLLAIGFRRIGEGLIKVATSEKVKDFVADGIHRGTDRFFYGDEKSKNVRRMYSVPLNDTQVEQYLGEEPYDHEKHRL